LTRSGDFADEVEALLRDVAPIVDVAPSLAGAVPDFLAEGEDGTTFVLNLKNSPPDDAPSRDAILNEVQGYDAVRGVDKALAVLPGSGVSEPEAGLVFQDDLQAVIREHLAESSGRSRPHRARTKPSSPKAMIFAAMPFGAEFGDVYFIAMVSAARRVKAACRRVDESDFVGDIVDKIHSMIRDCTAMIVDLSEARPNVLYEAGYAHALQKPVIHISRDSLSTLPFDVRNWNTLPYNPGEVHKLTPTLTRRLRAILSI
jgi:hypothetical protein